MMQKLKSIIRFIPVELIELLLWLLLLPAYYASQYLGGVPRVIIFFGIIIFALAYSMCVCVSWLANKIDAWADKLKNDHVAEPQPYHYAVGSCTVCDWRDGNHQTSLQASLKHALNTDHEVTFNTGSQLRSKSEKEHE